MGMPGFTAESAIYRGRPFARAVRPESDNDPQVVAQFGCGIYAALCVAALLDPGVDLVIAPPICAAYWATCGGDLS